ncbi:MAG TPA: GDL motif peptide-associated radical SAM/SPASM maturase [Pyrinomonadaceae bacterium]|nr:GDL motif peptide-associated radical SAM/SPASM maturase [Pyrinomonadaceae bacterium]
MDTTPRIPRLPTREDYERYVPVHVVWEITLACDLKCQHCGSRAGKPRPRELTTAECLEVVNQLAQLGTREITLIGGEAYLRHDWTEIIRAIRSHGIYCGVQTGARNLTDERLGKAIEAGLQGIGVSIDGLCEVHDKLRGVRGSYDMAMDALRRAKAAGLKTSVNTVIGSPNLCQLPELMEQIIAAGANHWQIQLAVAMGNAVDNEEILLQPYQLLELMPLLAELYHEGIDRGLLMIPGNNIGYFGPYEHIWRSYNQEQPHWTGCSAGQTGIGLESDGTVKGCPSLSTVGYAGGNIRELSLEDIWRSSEALHFGRLRSVDSLWGFCRSCYYAELCRGGCTWTADSLFGRPGNNPYCHYRALELEKRGLRERVVKKSNAPRQPFATGEFELITEPIPGTQIISEVLAEPLPPPPSMPLKLVQLTGRTIQRKPLARQRGEVPPRLEVCHSCDYYIWPGEEMCPHCGADVKAALASYQADARRRSALIAEVEGWIQEMQSGATT